VLQRRALKLAAAHLVLVRPMPRSTFFAVAASMVASAAALAGPLESFEFDAKFEPAFLPKSHLTLRSSGDSAKLVIDISGDSVSVPVDNSVAAEFVHDATNLTITPNKQEEGLDGCDVELRLKVAGKQRVTSKVWSPTKESAPTEDALLRALYKVTERSRIPSWDAEYLERLYGYFDNIQPRWKVLGGTPFTVRFYARLSSDDIPAFRSLVASLPRDEETVFDVTNLDSTGTLFYDEFVKATKEHSIKWRARDEWAEELAKMGIPEDRIIHTRPNQPLQPTTGRSDE
jgi:hypothetical protein